MFLRGIWVQQYISNFLQWKSSFVLFFNFQIFVDGCFLEYNKINYEKWKLSRSKIQTLIDFFFRFNRQNEFCKLLQISKHSQSCVPQNRLEFYIQFWHFLIMLPVAAHWPTQGMSFLTPETDLMAPVLSLGHGEGLGAGREEAWLVTSEVLIASYRPHGWNGSCVMCLR